MQQYKLVGLHGSMLVKDAFTQSEVLKSVYHRKTSFLYMIVQFPLKVLVWAWVLGPRRHLFFKLYVILLNSQAILLVCFANTEMKQQMVLSKNIQASLNFTLSMYPVVIWNKLHVYIFISMNRLAYQNFKRKYNNGQILTGARIDCLMNF